MISLFFRDREYLDLNLSKHNLRCGIFIIQKQFRHKSPIGNFDVSNRSLSKASRTLRITERAALIKAAAADKC